MRKIDWIDFLLIIFGLFIAYQLFLKIIGGSWQSDAVIIGLLMLNIGLTYKLAISHHKLEFKFDRHMAWHKVIDKN
tara:strand:- start:13 stop:240 length:228 start_codon:yes stop_codon:yes gene_type:complete